MVDFNGAEWILTLTDSGASGASLPTEHHWDTVSAIVPGTVAAALAGAGLYDAENPSALHGKDAWYETQFEAEPGRYRLCFDGLATIAEVYLNSEQVLDSRNMFRRYEVPITLNASNKLQICFRALESHLNVKGPRARWKPQLATSQGLRLIRTTLLGHMPGWCPEIHAVGPYRAVWIEPGCQPRVAFRQIRADLAPDGSATLTVLVELENCDEVPVLSCADASVKMTKLESGGFEATLRPSDVKPWMPHTHGTPSLYDVTIIAGGHSFSLGRTGFRRLEVDAGADGKGFGLKVNGISVFCRGAVWTNADLLNLSGDAETYRPYLEAARDGGMNMLRIGGTMLYETRAFFQLCDELGLLVFQDFQFANYDYPVKDEAFLEDVRAEIRDQLTVTQGCPSLAVLCGGSEIFQQGAMMGLPESRWKGSLCEEILPELSKTYRPDVLYAPNSPFGGSLPFSPNEGIAHYYGVGAYLRPLEDARRANIRFAGECLAFSNIPDQRSLDEALPVKPGHDPRWKAGVPRDRGAGWDFEDVRDHYLKTLFGVDPVNLRYGDPDRYLDLGRVVTGEVMERTFAEWRRKGSTCKGALVWTYQDLAVGAGWGLMDALGRPKPAYYALKRAFRPLQVCLTDEGTNGLAIHVINDLPDEKAVRLQLTCLKDGKTPVVNAQKDLVLKPHSNIELNAVELIGAFFDVTYAYRFGPLSHDVSVVRLIEPDTGVRLAESFHFIDNTILGSITKELSVETRLNKFENGSCELCFETVNFLAFARIHIEGFVVSQNWFHCAPGQGYKVRLEPRHPKNIAEPISGSLTALNAIGSVRLIE